ncbi:MAG: hypothetical protein ACI8Y4_001949 [Candidatus Poriferisodalaceae bacterium]|jgi:hypothetical protein
MGQVDPDVPNATIDETLPIAARTCAEIENRTATLSL